MADKIRVGVVGATVTGGGSGWGANAHVPALYVLPDFELKAVCTAHEDTAKASAEKFGAELAFHDYEAMASHPDVDLIAVAVRVPLHKDLVMAGLRAGKPVFCEWPLGATLTEAEEMAALARERSLLGAADLQARSDPSIRYARDLVRDGYIGDVLAANLSVIPRANTVRGPGRIWQGVRANGANPLTIPGGHSMDALCFILGEFAEVSARVATRIKEWRHADTGEPFAVDAPDAISVAGSLQNGAEVSVQIATVPTAPSGSRMEIYGTEGTLVITSGSINQGPNKLEGAQGADSLSELQPPDSYTLAPPETPAGPPLNVAHMYVRLGESLRSGASFDSDFELAVTRHRLIDAIERSSEQGKAVKLGG